MRLAAFLVVAPLLLTFPAIAAQPAADPLDGAWELGNGAHLAVDVAYHRMSIHLDGKPAVVMGKHECDTAYKGQDAFAWTRANDADNPDMLSSPDTGKSKAAAAWLHERGKRTAPSITVTCWEDTWVLRADGDAGVFEFLSEGGGDIVSARRTR